MNPPAGSIKSEVNDAVVGGIRQRGSDAVGLFIMGMARLLVGVVTLMAMLAASSIFGYDVTAVPFAGMTGLSAVVSWLITREKRQKSPAP